MLSIDLIMAAYAGASLYTLIYSTLQPSGSQGMTMKLNFSLNIEVFILKFIAKFSLVLGESSLVDT